MDKTVDSDGKSKLLLLTNSAGEQQPDSGIMNQQQEMGGSPIQPINEDPTEVQGKSYKESTDELMTTVGDIAEDKPITKPDLPDTTVPDIPFPDLVSTTLMKIEMDIKEVQESFGKMGNRISNLESLAEKTANQVSYLPPNVRMLGKKIDGLTTSISETRYRGLLLDLLGIFDLIDQLLLSSRDTEHYSSEDHRRNYEILRTQIRQILDVNELSEISTDGFFDPKIHRAKGSIPCDDPGKVNRILKVYRPGFRTEESILRFAEVAIGKLETVKMVRSDDVILTGRPAEVKSENRVKPDKTKKPGDDSPVADRDTIMEPVITMKDFLGKSDYIPPDYDIPD
ncbi:MAG: nucleotide exchange factor GrpE [Candidatus Eremiobacteraeota bacterium]|nr:nucleotide exchange factor GrpE [Candidatus Eremiobacteraeota bacterium]